MTMKKAIKTKKNKKGFTLVELVIVIAVLAIISAIAVPLISTALHSAKLSVMKSDSETLDMLVAECRTNAVTHNRQVTYGSGNVTASNATIEDIMYSNYIDIETDNGSDTFFTRSIGQETYQMVYCNGHVCISGGDNDYGTPVSDITEAGDTGCVELTASTSMVQLCGSF